MTDSAETTDYAESWSRYVRFMLPAYRSALAELPMPTGTHGFDAGCGPGALIPLLLDAGGPGGRVTGIDISRPHLAAAERLIAERGLQDRVRLLTGDLQERLPFDDAHFDWAWSADVIYPHRLGDPRRVVRELARVVRPGGFVALFFSNYFRGVLCPGWPNLELPLLAASGRYWYGSSHASEHYERAAAWLRAAGLNKVTISSHLVHHAAPLEAEITGYLEEYLRLKYERVTREDVHAAGLSDADWEQWKALISPGSGQFILNDPDYYCVDLGMLTVGRVG